MSEYELLTILSAFVLVYSAFAKLLERTPVNGALVYVATGVVLGPAVLGVLKLDVDAEGISLLAELALAVVLFSDSASSNLSVLRRVEEIPFRLLLIGLPLTIAFGFGVGLLVFPDLGWVAVALLATMVAPTDAALGKAVVTNPSVPSSVRESLNVESGLNDGICVPVLLLFLALARGEAEGAQETTWLAVSLAAQAIGIGLAIGLGVGGVGSVALRTVLNRGWIGGSWMQLPVIAMAFLAFASAQWCGGSGFIASFVGGMTFGALARSDKEAVLESAEATGDLLAMLTWLMFGTLVFAEPFGMPDWRVLLYAVTSLTVVRMLPVFLCLLRLRLRLDTSLFIGWFGPRGLATIVFAVMVVNESIPGGPVVVTTATWTILLSVVAHGLSANPLAGLYGRRVGDAEI